MENTKKTLSTLIFTLFLSLVLINCKDPKGQQPDDGPKPETVDRPSEIIEVDVARQQYLTYEKRRIDLIQKYEDSVDGYYDKGKIRQEQNERQAQEDSNDPNGKRFDVARYVHWDYETIKNYLKYIEQEAEAANVEISTLRFYFSNYPEGDTAAVHPRQNSIIITPTLHKDKREYIFSIDERDTENIKPLLLTDGFLPIQGQEKGMGGTNDQDKRSYASFLPETTTVNSSAAVSPFQPGTSVSMNKGNSAPPPHHEQ